MTGRRKSMKSRHEGEKKGMWEEGKEDDDEGQEEGQGDIFQIKSN